MPALCSSCQLVLSASCCPASGGAAWACGASDLWNFAVGAASQPAAGSAALLLPIALQWALQDMAKLMQVWSWPVPRCVCELCVGFGGTGGCVVRLASDQQWSRNTARNGRHMQGSFRPGAVDTVSVHLQPRGVAPNLWACRAGRWSI